LERQNCQTAEARSDQMLPSARTDRKRDSLVVRRSIARCGLVAIGSALAGCLLLAGWAMYARGAASNEAEAEAQSVAHNTSIRLVRQAITLQSLLDAQEDHDRSVLQLYLQLERETLPALELQVVGALEAHPCSDDARKEVRQAVHAFVGETRAHSQRMIDALQREGARSRRAAQDLATEVAALARMDRERLRGQSERTQWVAADLEGPLLALAAELRRPNATIDLSLEQLGQWETAAASMAAEGRPSAETLRLVRGLAASVELPHNHKGRNAVLSASDPAADFTALLQRARLHRHRDDLAGALGRWQAHAASVWDVVELIEKLRAMHVFPLTMLKLHPHEWTHIISDAMNAGSPPKFEPFDADQ